MQRACLAHPILFSTHSAESAARLSDNPSVDVEMATSSHSLLPQELPTTDQSSNSGIQQPAVAARQSASPSASVKSAAEATSPANSPAASPDISAVAAVSTERHFTQRHLSDAGPSAAIVQPESLHPPGGHVHGASAAHAGAVSSSQPTGEVITPGKAGSQGVKGSADFIITAADTHGKPQVMERVFLTSPHLLAGMTASSPSQAMDSPGDQSSSKPAAQQTRHRSPVAGASGMGDSMAATKHPSASAGHRLPSSTDNGNSSLRQSSAAAASRSPGRQAAPVGSLAGAQAGVNLPAEAGKAVGDKSKHSSPTRQQSPATTEHVEPDGRPQSRGSASPKGQPNHGNMSVPNMLSDAPFEAVSGVGNPEKATLSMLGNWIYHNDLHEDWVMAHAKCSVNGSSSHCKVLSSTTNACITAGSPVTELGLGVSPQESRLAQLIQKAPATSRTPNGTPAVAVPLLRSPAGRQTPPSSSKQDRGVSANMILDLQKQVEALKAKVQVPIVPICR